VDEALDDGGDACRVGEYGSPLCEREVRRDDETSLCVAAVDQLVEQIGMSTAVRQKSDFIDGEHCERGVVAEAPLECTRRVLRGEVEQQIGRRDEACGESCEHSLVDDVLGDHRLSEAGGCDEDDVHRVLDEIEGDDRLDERAIDLRGPLPFEVGHELELGQARHLGASLEAALVAFALLEVDHVLEQLDGPETLLDGRGDEVVEQAGGGAHLQRREPMSQLGHDTFSSLSRMAS
jgi:hypothetical protein